MRNTENVRRSVAPNLLVQFPLAELTLQLAVDPSKSRRSIPARVDGRSQQEPTVDPSKSRRQESTVDPSKSQQSIPARADGKSRRLIPTEDADDAVLSRHATPGARPGGVPGFHADVRRPAAMLLRHHPLRRRVWLGLVALLS
jgi:hypothetical protein